MSRYRWTCRHLIRFDFIVCSLLNLRRGLCALVHAHEGYAGAFGEAVHGRRRVRVDRQACDPATSGEANIAGLSRAYSLWSWVPAALTRRRSARGSSFRTVDSRTSFSNRGVLLEEHRQDLRTKFLLVRNGRGKQLAFRGLFREGFRCRPRLTRHAESQLMLVTCRPCEQRVSDGFFRALLCRPHCRGIVWRDRFRDLDVDALRPRGPRWSARLSPRRV
jgi:hypothetical protein